MTISKSEVNTIQEYKGVKYTQTKWKFSIFKWLRNNIEDTK